MGNATPLGALGEGLIAGAIGSGAQNLFFRVARPLTPRPPEDAFDPPEDEQCDETPLSTVARRLVEGLAQRGPLDDDAKRRAASLVHYAFGAGWGGLYGLLRASAPKTWSAPGVAGFAVGVWMLSDNLLLPTLRLSAWPNHYPLRSHLFALVAHLAYGASVAGALAVFDRLRRD